MSAFEYQLQRSVRRRSISIVVRRGQVKVIAPVFVPKFRIEQFVKSKTPWVLDKLKAQQDWAQAQALGQKQYVDGERFLYLGDEVTLTVTSGTKSQVVLRDWQLQVTISNRVKPENRQANVKRLVKDWYKATLNDLVMPRVDEYTQLMQVSPSQVEVKSYTRRWGSCSARGVVSFNLLLMMAPTWVIDYVIVHELAHLEHMNHSARFWALVERYYPDHKAAKDYLKHRSPVMTL